MVKCARHTVLAPLPKGPRALPDAPATNRVPWSTVKQRRDQENNNRSENNRGSFPLHILLAPWSIDQTLTDPAMTWKKAYRTLSDHVVGEVPTYQAPIQINYVADRHSSTTNHPSIRERPAAVD